MKCVHLRDGERTPRSILPCKELSKLPTATVPLLPGGGRARGLQEEPLGAVLGLMGNPGTGVGSCPCAPCNSYTYLHTRVCKRIFPYTPAAPTFSRTNARANPRTQLHAQKRCTRGLGDTAGLRGAGRTPSLHLHPRQSSGCAAWAAVPRVPLCQPKIQKPGKGKVLLPQRSLHPLEVGKGLGGRSQRLAPAPCPGREPPHSRPSEPRGAAPAPAPPPPRGAGRRKYPRLFLGLHGSPSRDSSRARHR